MYNSIKPGQDNIWHMGVRCYSSKDLYNWKDEGVIIPPDMEDETSPLHPASMMDRPHIVYNEKTKKYVAWLKIMNEPPCFTVLTADDILGPYEIQGNPHVDDTSKTSFNCQISSVFKHPTKKDLYIAVGDRWRPELPELEGEEFTNGKAYEKTAQKFREIFDPEVEFIFDESAAKDMFINSSVSDYVWLPLKFDGDKVRIEWMDEWKVEDFE